MGKTLKTVICFIFICGIAQGQTLPLSPRLDSLRVSVFNELPLATTGSALLTTARVSRQVNMAIWDVCQSFPAYEKADTVIASRAAEGGTLNSDFLRATLVMRMIGDSVRIPLIPLNLDSIQPLNQLVEANLQDLDVENDPNKWYTRNYRLYTHPKVRRESSEADTFLVHYEAMAPKLASDTDTTVIDKNFLQAVVYYATAKCWLLRKRSDLAETYFALSKMAGKEAEAKKAEQRGRE